MSRSRTSWARMAGGCQEAAGPREWAQPTWVCTTCHRGSPFGLTERTSGRREEAIVPTLDMPERPHLDSFRRQARTLQRAARAGDPDAIARLARHHRGGDTSGVTLSVAQLVVAR